MTTIEVELLIITIVLSIQCIIMIVLIAEALIVVTRLKRLVDKAEHVITNVGSAAETLKHLSKASKSRFPLVSYIANLFSKDDGER